MKKRAIAKLLGGACIASTLAPLAFAQAVENPETIELAPIVVTGEVFTRNLDKTATSVTVVTEDELENEVENDSIADAILDVPNVLYSATGGQGGAPTIRGQDAEGPNSGANAFLGGTSPRAAVNVDGHYLSYNELVFSSTSAWDVDSIEVFRGPQNSAQGANSIAGAIVVNTKDPTFVREGAAQLQFGSNDMKRASLAVSGPLSDQVAARLSLDYYGRSNYIDYTNPSFVEGATNLDQEAKTARFKLLWQPTDMPELEAKLTFSHTDTNRPTWEAATEPFEDLESIASANPSWRQRTDTAIADVSYDLTGAVTITNKLQYSEMLTDRVTEPVTSGTAQIDQTNLSNETRVTFGDDVSVFSGVAGLYMSETESDEMLNLGAMSIYDDTKTSLGLFTEMNWRFADRWTLTGGLRYQRDRIQRDGVSSLANNDLNYDQTFEEWLPKLALAYELSDNTTIGAQVSKGYTPGGVTLNIASMEYVTFEKETALNYELFGRAHLLEDRLFLNANLFYTDYSDAQRYVVTNLPENLGYAVTVNAEKARAYGMEFSADYMARDNLRLTGGLGLLKTEINKFRSAAADYQGNEFGRSPDFTLSVGAEWDITPDLRFSAQVKHTDGYYSDDTNDETTQIDAFTVANARIAYSPRDNLELFGYVNNIFDDHSETYIRLTRARPASYYEATTVTPREFGLGLKVNF
ncbi:TonB-dependent receptor [Actibacterium lipolyticum]|uniref:Pesticin receptor n=1 Tax=Actibacterium lipolyticum TaxID=1524263 RepID=A0A238L7I2_9RHOB|nr:TonB-dependent receptor [Actibacterium lipolyticum]SMX51063.1 Pesticin receptor precursor [Actibacterium lipolyticum]